MCFPHKTKGNIKALMRKKNSYWHTALSEVSGSDVAEGLSSSGPSRTTVCSWKGNTFSGFIFYVRALAVEGLCDPRPSHIVLYPCPSGLESFETYCNNMIFRSLVRRSICVHKFMVLTLVHALVTCRVWFGWAFCSHGKLKLSFDVLLTVHLSII